LFAVMLGTWRTPRCFTKVSEINFHFLGRSLSFLKLYIGTASTLQLIQVESSPLSQYGYTYKVRIFVGRWQQKYASILTISLLIPLHPHTQ
jgi:hypothetical protein